MWTGQGARRFPERHTNDSGSVKFPPSLLQQEGAQRSPVDVTLFLHLISAVEEAAVLLSDQHAVEQEAIFLLGSTVG